MKLYAILDVLTNIWQDFHLNGLIFDPVDQISTELLIFALFYDFNWLPNYLFVSIVNHLCNKLKEWSEILLRHRSVRQCYEMWIIDYQRLCERPWNDRVSEIVKLMFCWGISMKRINVNIKFFYVVNEWGHKTPSEHQREERNINIQTLDIRLRSHGNH